MLKHIISLLLIVSPSAYASDWGDIETSGVPSENLKLCILEKYAPEPNLTSLGISKPDCSSVDLDNRFHMEYNYAHSESFNEQVQALNINFFFKKKFRPFIVGLPKERTPYIAAVVSHWKVGLPTQDKEQALSMVSDTRRPIEFSYHFEPLEEDDILFDHSLPKYAAQMEMIVDEYNVIEKRTIFGTTVIATYKRGDGFGYQQQKAHRTQKANEEAKDISLLGTTLLGATRESMQIALAKAGLTKLSSEDGIDVYDSSQVAPGTHSLSVGFTSSGKFAMATYDFSMKGGQVSERTVLEKLSQKYGNHALIGENMSDVLKAGWLFGWIQIYVDKDEPNRVIKLHYIDRTNYFQFEEEQKNKLRKSDSFAF